jgi:hypothetical protein
MDISLFVSLIAKVDTNTLTPISFFPTHLTPTPTGTMAANTDIKFLLVVLDNVTITPSFANKAIEKWRK